MSAMEQNMEARRQRLLEEVRRLIESGGFEGLTMRELASASGVTVPTIYNLIGNKEAVLLAAVEEQTQGFTLALERVQGDLIEVVEATVRNWFVGPVTIERCCWPSPVPSTRVQRNDTPLRPSPGKSGAH